ncbi:uncharacterized protein LOC110450503 [Mizuhopecten yessoensis]|uniref:uncharacterized protein LOC110450503 n=1 Tax=Mizuhopecten yessoensis TaxID=6573 RepID=UPI000B45B2F3|nr:uncharacterized protein LOC110450503 [Mizuhopecten yessoensis]
MKIVVKETREPCGTNAECKPEDGQYTCVCKARHTGDPLKACTEAKKPHCIAETKISCSSAKGHPRRCTKPVIKYLTWVSKTDDLKCVFGLSYGRQKNEVWVNGECGGTFDVCYIPENISYEPKTTPVTSVKNKPGSEYERKDKKNDLEIFLVFFHSIK